MIEKGDLIVKKVIKIFSLTIAFILILCTFLISGSREINASDGLYNLAGEYVGTYTFSGGQVGVYLKVYGESGQDYGKYSSILYTYSLSSKSMIGRYPLNVSYNASTKQYELTTTKPKYLNIAGTLSKGIFSGYLTTDNKSKYKFSTTKVVYQPQASTSIYLDKLLGKFDSNSTTTSYRYSVYKDGNGRYFAICTIFSGNPRVEIGSALYYVYYDVSTKIYKMIGKHWINKPYTGGWSLDDGFIELQGNTLYERSGYNGSNSVIKFTKINEEPIIPLPGGYTEDRAMTKEDMIVFSEAMNRYKVGVMYEPILVASQVVAGMNYRFTATASGVFPDADPFPVYVYIFKPLKGLAEVVNIVDI